MNREQIIRMAQQAGAFTELSATPEKDVAFLERFAALVVAAENEALREALQSLLWYVDQLEMIVYPKDENEVHKEVAKARAALARAGEKT